MVRADRQWPRTREEKEKGRNVGEAFDITSHESDVLLVVLPAVQSSTIIFYLGRHLTLESRACPHRDPAHTRGMSHEAALRAKANSAQSKRTGERRAKRRTVRRMHVPESWLSSRRHIAARRRGPCIHPGITAMLTSHSHTQADIACTWLILVQQQ